MALAKSSRPAFELKRTRDESSARRYTDGAGWGAIAWDGAATSTSSPSPASARAALFPAAAVDAAADGKGTGTAGGDRDDDDEDDMDSRMTRGVE